MLQDALDAVLDRSALRFEVGDERRRTPAGPRVGEVGPQVEVAVDQGVGGGTGLVAAADERAHVAEPVAEGRADLEVEQAEVVARHRLVGDLVQTADLRLCADPGVHRDGAQPDHGQRAHDQRGQGQHRQGDPVTRGRLRLAIGGRASHTLHTSEVVNSRALVDSAQEGR